MAVEFFHYQSPQKYRTRLGSNARPLDLQSDTYLQSDTLPAALCGPVNVESEQEQQLTLLNPGQPKL